MVKNYGTIRIKKGESAAKQMYKARKKAEGKRKVGSAGMGSGGDVRDRFRNAYSPGKHARKSGKK